MTAFALYLLKVIICSGVLFLYYYLALRNKLFHQWNRFYLLAAIVLSLVAPIVQVTIMHRADETAKAIQMLQVFESAGGYLEEVTINGRPSISTDQWLMMGYIVISGMFLITVLLSFQKIISILKSHTVQWIEKIKFVNTKVQGTPFSFFNFIFWNEDIDLQTETGQQIFEHELVHVKEKHTVDKLFVQLVLIVFWCNPFFWLIRRELKIIHEFIADKKAVGEHGTAALAAMILNSFYPTHFNSLTNQFFQTSIKRRIAMLAKIQNPRINYLSRMLVLSVSILTVLAFTLRTKTVTVPTVKLDKAITVVIDAGHGMMANGKYNGAVVENVAEDYIVLAIANKIKALNTNDQIKIVLTRPTEQIVDLNKRVDIARENNADLFLSLHINALPPNSGSSGKEMSGFQVYVSNKQTAFQQQSEILGSVLREELNSAYPTETSLYKRQAGVWVLDQNVCPSVMVECGWLTTKKDRDYIIKENNQYDVAQKILTAIERYAVSKTGSDNESSFLNKDDGLVIGSNTIGKTQTPGLDTTPKKQVTIKEVTLENPKASDQENIFRNKRDPLNPPLIILDGKEISEKDVKKINANSISFMTVLKGQTAIELYGEKAKNGAILIETNSNVEVKEVTLQPLPDTIPKKGKEDVNQIFTKVEIEPSVDHKQWIRHLQTQLQRSIENAAAKGIDPGTYTIQIKFLVLKDGSVTDVKALNDPGYGLAEAAVKTVQNGPKWNPGQQNGKPVNAYHTQPITFVVQEDGIDKKNKVSPDKTK